MKEYRVIDCGPSRVEERLNRYAAEGFAILYYHTYKVTQYSSRGGVPVGEYIHYSITMQRQTEPAASEER